MFRTLSLLAATTLALGAIPEAAQAQATPLPGVASQHCPTQWAAVEALAPGAWDGINALESDPSGTPAYNAAYDRYTTGLQVLQEFFGDVAAVTSGDANARPDIALMAARLDLVQCLRLTQAQRDTIVDRVVTLQDLPEAQVREGLFRGYAILDCTNTIPASEAIFQLDRSAPSFWDDAAQIFEATFTPCG